MQQDVYIPTKEIVVNGTVHPKGKDLPAKFDPERLAAGLSSGKIVKRPVETTAVEPAAAVAINTGKPATEKKGGK